MKARKRRLSSRFSVVFLAVTLTAQAAAPFVSNVRSAPRPGTKLVDIYYDVVDADGDRLTITVAVTDTGVATYTIPATNFTGDVGANISLNQGRHIVWNAGLDWPNKFSANLRFRVTATDPTDLTDAVPLGTALIPAGSFEMGDTLNEGGEYDRQYERPVHTVYVGAFFIDRTEVTKALWNEVYRWATNHGYSIDSASSGKADDHPVGSVEWFDAVKWCNARSEKEGRLPAYYTDAAQTKPYRTGPVAVQNGWVKWNTGYRLPTEAEWEKAARGGTSGRRFPWSDTDNITHSRANYYSLSDWAYDISPTRGNHPTYQNGASPVDSFAPNGYGLYGMAGNVWEWCWDWWSASYYGASPATDPRGPATGSYRVRRGGSWDNFAYNIRTAYRGYDIPGRNYGVFGFRCVVPAFGLMAASHSVESNVTTVDTRDDVLTDSDKDGMPDGWEVANGLERLESVDAQLDTDGDGLSNLTEFRAGTDPKDPASCLRIESVSAAGVNGVEIVWSSVPGRLYSVFRSTDVERSFTALAEHLLATPPKNVYLDTAATRANQFFYRIKVE